MELAIERASCHGLQLKFVSLDSDRRGEVFHGEGLEGQGTDLQGCR